MKSKIIKAKIEMINMGILPALTGRDLIEMRLTMSESEKRQIALAEQQLKQQADPIQAIINNPNLTQAEKDKAIALTKDALKDEWGAKMRKYLIIGGIGLVAIGIIAYMIKRKK